MRTYSSDSARKRNVLSLISLIASSYCPVSDQAHIALTVCTCRACQHTGRTAVSLVVGKKKLKVRLSGFDNTGRIGMYYHIRRNLCCAGFPEFRIAFLLYHAQAARAVDFCSLIIAESRNKDVVLSADFEDGLSGKPVEPLFRRCLICIYSRLHLLLNSLYCAKFTGFLTLAALNADSGIDLMLLFLLAADRAHRTVSCTGLYSPCSPL